jgi:hypothetical protein
VTDPVRMAADAAVKQFIGPAAVISKWEGPRQHDWSWQFAFHAPGSGGGDLLLKVPRWQEALTLEDALAAGEQDSTHRELDGLRRIEAAVLASGDPGLTAVAPLSYVSAVNGILMRRLDAVSLRDRLGMGRGRGDVAALFGRLGRWIGIFHAIDGPAETRPLSAAGEVGELRDLEARLNGAGVAPRGLLPAVAMLRLAAEEMDGVPELVTEIHGDLNISNVLVGRDDRVAVIDPNRETGSVLDDLARVITDVRLDGSQLASGGLLRTAAHVAAWEERLVAAAGYGEEPLLRYRLARHALERWAEVELEVTGPARVALLPGRTLLRRVVSHRLAAIV